MAERISGNRMSDSDEILQWNVNGHSVLELGAGVGLTGIIASLAGASEVVISDYPTDVILKNIKRNVDENAKLFDHRPPLVQGHEWGEFEDDFSISKKHHFSHILAADCFWMPQVHRELVESMLQFLSLDATAQVLAIGGFHTGRAKLAAFFFTASRMGLVAEQIYEENARGERRPWLVERDGGREDPTQRKKWLVVARLSRQKPGPAPEIDFSG